MSEAQSKLNRSELMEMAEVAMKCERYKDAVRFITDAIKAYSKPEFTKEERLLVSNGFRNLIGGCRVAMKSVTSSIKSSADIPQHTVVLMERYKTQLANEVVRLCQIAIHMVDDYLLPVALDPINVISFLKMKADCFRYIAEVVPPQEQEANVRQSLEAYSKAMDLALKFLAPPDLIRLEIALSFSVFLFEILNDPLLACELSQFTLDEVSHYELKISKESFRASLVVINLLQHDVYVWTSVASTGEIKQTETQRKLAEEVRKSNIFPVKKFSDATKRDTLTTSTLSMGLQPLTMPTYGDYGVAIKTEVSEISILTSLTTCSIRTHNSGDENKAPNNRQP